MATDLEILKTNLTKLRKLEQENLAVFVQKVEQGKAYVNERLIKVKRDLAAEALVPGRIRELDSWKRTVCKRYVQTISMVQTKVTFLYCCCV